MAVTVRPAPESAAGTDVTLELPEPARPGGSPPAGTRRPLSPLAALTAAATAALGLVLFYLMGAIFREVIPPMLVFGGLAIAAAAAIVLVLAGNVALTAPVHDTSERALIGPAAAPSLLAGESIRSLRRADVISGRLSFGSPPEQSTIGVVKPLIPVG
jgi:hypothetical protein